MSCASPNLPRPRPRSTCWASATKMGSSADQPYIDFAYKLVLYDGRPTLKLSTGKVTWGLGQAALAQLRNRTA